MNDLFEHAIMGGVKVCKTIKQLDPEISIIATTVNIMSDDKKRYLESGGSLHLGKPIQIHELYQCFELLSQPDKKI